MYVHRMCRELSSSVRLCEAFKAFLCGRFVARIQYDDQISVRICVVFVLDPRLTEGPRILGTLGSVRFSVHKLITQLCVALIRKSGSKHSTHTKGAIGLLPGLPGPRRHLEDMLLITEFEEDIHEHR